MKRFMYAMALAMICATAGCSHDDAAAGSTPIAGIPGTKTLARGDTLSRAKQKREDASPDSASSSAGPSGAQGGSNALAGSDNY